jgi:hypothetical protein
MMMGMEQQRRRRRQQQQILSNKAPSPAYGKATAAQLLLSVYRSGVMPRLIWRPAAVAVVVLLLLFQPATPLNPCQFCGCCRFGTAHAAVRA